MTYIYGTSFLFFIKILCEPWTQFIKDTVIGICGWPLPRKIIIVKLNIIIPPYGSIDAILQKIPWWIDVYMVAVWVDAIWSKKLHLALHR